MQEEQYGRSDESLVPGPRFESVPSEELWRAAIEAAREAASGAAELRRVLDADRALDGPYIALRTAASRS